MEPWAVWREQTGRPDKWHQKQLLRCSLFLFLDCVLSLVQGNRHTGRGYSKLNFSLREMNFKPLRIHSRSFGRKLSKICRSVELGAVWREQTGRPDDAPKTAPSLFALTFRTVFCLQLPRWYAMKYIRNLVLSKTWVWWEIWWLITIFSQCQPKQNTQVRPAFIVSVNLVDILWFLLWYSGYAF